MKTLYLSDLDGTLLNSSERVSEYTIKTINRFIEKGGYFTYATARSFVTAPKVTSGLNIKLPVIYYNGACIRDNVTKEMLSSIRFTRDEVGYILSVLSAHGVYPIVYAYQNGVERFSYIKRYATPAMEAFLHSRPGDPRRYEAESLDELYSGEVFYFACMDTEATLSPVHDIFKADDRFYCVYQIDLYDNTQWCELLPAEATKANAALKLKSMLGCDKIIAFGDSENDIELFSIADESYAVENACASLKELATGIIGGNNADSVAKWIDANGRPE